MRWNINVLPAEGGVAIVNMADVRCVQTAIVFGGIEGTRVTFRNGDVMDFRDNMCTWLEGVLSEAQLKGLG